MMHQLTGMAVFARVVESRSFSEAAKQLGLSKSAVSKAVARLEDRLGARLLNRTTRRVAPTEVGALFYEHCARVLAEAEEAERVVGAMHAEPRGVLKVNAPMSFGVLHLAPAIPDFLTLYPGLRVEMTLNDSFVDLLEEGFDLGVRIAALADSSLVARRLAKNRRVVCGAPDYFARRGEPKVPEDLRDHDCLGYTLLASNDGWRFDGPGGTRSIRISGSFAANNGEALKAAALAGTGLILTPTFLVGPELRSGLLRPVLVEYCTVETAIYAVYPSRRHLSAKIRAFVDFLAARFGPEPYWDAGLPAFDTPPARRPARPKVAEP